MKHFFTANWRKIIILAILLYLPTLFAVTEAFVISSPVLFIILMIITMPIRLFADGDVILQYLDYFIPVGILLFSSLIIFFWQKSLIGKIIVILVVLVPLLLNVNNIYTIYNTDFSPPTPGCVPTGGFQSQSELTELQLRCYEMKTEEDCQRFNNINSSLTNGSLCAWATPL